MVKKHSFKILLIAVSLLSFSLDSLALDPVVEKLETKKTGDVSMPEIEIRELPGGAKLYYLQDKELPVVKVSSYFTFGSYGITEEEKGLSSFFMSAWKSGGLEGMTPDQVDEELELLATSIWSSAGGQLSSFGVKTLLKNLKDSFDVYFGLMKTPTFDSDRVEVLRKSYLDSILRRNEQPLPIAKREFLQKLYGNSSPHAWNYNKTTVGRLTRERLQEFHKNYVGPKRLLMAATSPLTADEFIARLKPYLDGWNPTTKNFPQGKEVLKKWVGSTNFVQKEGNQTAIVLGHFGEKRFNPDKFKLILANEILGGSTFGSKLGDRLRTDLGLTYGIGSRFDFYSDYGSFFIATRTKSESTLDALNEIYSILNDFVTGKSITEADLEFAKERIINQLVFQYESRFNLVTMQLEDDFFGYPKNYLAKYQKEIRAVKLEDMKAVLPKYFFPDQMIVMMAGDKSKISGLKTIKNLKELPLDME